mgnify:CR=1 FL=1
MESVATIVRGDYTGVTMNGKEVYKFATSKVPAVLKEALENANIGVEDIDWLLLHQANSRLRVRVSVSGSNRVSVSVSSSVRNRVRVAASACKTSIGYSCPGQHWPALDLPAACARRPITSRQSPKTHSSPSPVVIPVRIMG